MNNNKKMSFWYSWPVIIATFILCWPGGLPICLPIGLYLLIKRCSMDEKARSIVMKITGIVLIIFGVLGFVDLFDNLNATNIVLTLLCTIAGIGVLIKDKKIKKEKEIIKQYLPIIVNRGIHEIDVIASTVGLPYDVVHNDIIILINKGYLKNAYIDERLKEIVFPDNHPSNENATTQGAFIQSKVVTCPCCGANNTIYGNVGECEYCGSPIKI